MLYFFQMKLLFHKQILIQLLLELGHFQLEGKNLIMSIQSFDFFLLQLRCDFVNIWLVAQLHLFSLFLLLLSLFFHFVDLIVQLRSFLPGIIFEILESFFKIVDLLINLAINLCDSSLHAFLSIL